MLKKENSIDFENEDKEILCLVPLDFGLNFFKKIKNYLLNKILKFINTIIL